MRRKNHLLAAISLVSLMALGVFVYATIFVINRAFDTVEQRDVHQNTGRAVDALAARVDLLEFKVTDWAAWDDTYNFVENKNGAYIKSNLGNNSLQNLGLNFMLFYNEKQQLVYAKGINVDTDGDAPVPTGLTDAFKPGSSFLAKDESSLSKGLLVLPDNTVQFVSMPILTSNGDGPMHGTLIFAYYLSPSEVDNLSSVTHLKLNYVRLTNATIPADVTAAVGHPTKPITAIKAFSSTKIVGYQTINDAYGRPDLVAVVTMPRDIHDVAQSALRRFFVFILFDTLAAAVIVIILMRVISVKDHTITLKNEFFSIASHELRTPLTVIRDYSQLMKFKFSKDIGNPEFDKMADNIDKTSANLIGLVNTFLDAARLDSGTIPFQTEDFSLHELTESFLPELAVTARNKGVTLTADCPPDLPLIRADKVRVQQIITNLFGNALKFTDQGSITIKAQPEGKLIVVYVTDTGRGMSEEDARNLFQRFRQVHTKDALHGSGLGLFISKKLVEQMGGTIKLESYAPGVGTSISFTLPVAGAEPMAHAAKNLTPKKSSAMSEPLAPATELKVVPSAPDVNTQPQPAPAPQPPVQPIPPSSIVTPPENNDPPNLPSAPLS
jgi:signal transduction histidine kinase